MKKEEKQLIFNLLKTADAYECGYTRKKFAGDPVFADDIESQVQMSGSSPNMTNNASPNITNIESSNMTNTVSSDTAHSVTSGMTNTQADVSFPGLTRESAQDKAVPSPDTTNNAGGLSLNELNTKILRCTRCGLARTRNNVVPGMGVENPEVLVIGEGPGHDEDMQGLPFVGKAGFLLDKMLAAIGLDRNRNCYIANVVKCRPPENRNPLPDEQAACFSFLEAQIHILKPKMILCMGKIAIEKLTGLSIPITQRHGEFFDYQGIPVMPTYHPSALLRNEELKRPAWEDLKKFKRRLDEIEAN